MCVENVYKWLDNVQKWLHIYTMSIYVYTMTRPVFYVFRHVSTMSWHVWTMSRHISLWCQLLSMVPLHSLGNNDQNKVKHDFFNHVMPLVTALLSCDANCIINGTILFIRQRQLETGVTWLLFMRCCWHQCQQHMILVALSMALFCLLG